MKRLIQLALLIACLSVMAWGQGSYTLGNTGTGGSNDAGANFQAARVRITPLTVSTVTDLNMRLGNVAGSMDLGLMDSSNANGRAKNYICFGTNSSLSANSPNAVTPSGCGSLPAFIPVFITDNQSSSTTQRKYNAGGTVGNYEVQTYGTWINFPNPPQLTGASTYSMYANLAFDNTKMFTIARASISTGNVSATTPAVDTTALGGATFILARNGGQELGGSSVVPTTSTGDTFTCLSSYSIAQGGSGTGDIHEQLCYIPGPITTSSTQTFTCNNVKAHCVFYVLGGTLGNSLVYQSGSDIGATCSACTSLSPGTETPVTANALIVTAFVDNSTNDSALTIPSGGFVRFDGYIDSDDGINLPGDVNLGNQAGGGPANGGMVYYINAPASGITPTWSITSSGSQNMAAAAAVFLSQSPAGSQQIGAFIVGP